MIKVLQDWREIGEGTMVLQERGLALHEGPQKNWDHFLLSQLIEARGCQGAFLDLGCGTFFTLELFYSLGCRDVTGVDFTIMRRAWARMLFFMRAGRLWRFPFKVLAGDITKFDGRGRKFDFVSCVSVIEHGVRMEEFFQRCAAMLNPGGTLFVTTDYWEDSTFVQENAAYGLPWFVFNRGQIKEMVVLAGRHGLRLLEGAGEIPPCSERTVRHMGQEYTFLAMVFVLDSRTV